jgi:hypothetical protein
MASSGALADRDEQESLKHQQRRPHERAQYRVPDPARESAKNRRGASEKEQAQKRAFA